MVPSWEPVQLLQPGMGVPGRPELGQEPLITTLAPARAEGEFGGLRASPCGACHWGITTSWKCLGQGCKECPLPQLWFSETPKSLASHPRGGGRGRQSWEASDCSRCFQLTFQNGLLLAAGRADGRGEEACGTLGRRAHA